MPEETVEGKTSTVDTSQRLTPPESKPRRSRAFRVLVWIIVLFLFGLLFWVIIHHKEVAATAPRGRRTFVGTVTLTTATAKKGSIGVYLQAIGTVTPVHTDTITSQASGLITQVNYREGETVQKGQRLIQIDPRPYAAQVLAAEGALERDTNVLAQAKMDLTRYQEAWAKNAVARQTLEDQEKLVLQEEGTVKADQGTLQADQVNLTFCDITAPISGKVGLRLVDPGNVVTSSSATPLVVITQMEPITVVFTIPEDNVDEVQTQMRKGKPLEVDAFDRAQQTKLATGKLLSLNNQIDTTTGTLKLRAIFDNRNDVLYPNLFVNARLLVKTLDNAVLIPASAIQYNGEEAFVYLIQNNTAHIHDVKAGVTDSGMTAVTGLNPGDVVATSSFEKLQNGSSVSIAKGAPAPSSTSESNAP
jgi:membrane fusion protein, multidrug efflux system